ncbi:MAG: succinylglutamate-semialdehyde dehydrogenase [Alphaproteobacteria bacterium HGW-Alphaproteobacteria-18]|nr:MAG: succinylglutamate-semialdehyde dehydrogenase [Alphaproteobacteria bacterium HGW-Alphaproteobacteria-18]
MSSLSYIGGKWIAGKGTPWVRTCPATGEIVWSGHAATPEQVTRAVQAARAAFPDWAARPQSEREAVLIRYAEQLRARRESLAIAISRDMGKLITESMSEADSMSAKIAVSIAAQAERAGEYSQATDFGRLELTHRPHGVMAVFGPFNFPGHLPNGHIVPALLAGNTCIFKPSELAPSVAPIMVDAFEAAGLPAGCLNLIQGGRETGAALLNSDINGLLFTGSEATGRYFHKHFAGRPEVILALELGGNNPLIIWEPADIETAAEIAIQSAYVTTGQRCSCARRIILPAGEFGNRVAALIAERVRHLAIGSWHQKDAFMGPLVSPDAAEKAVAFQARLVASGGGLIVPLQHADPHLGFVTAGLLEMPSVCAPDEECFAPLLQIYRASDLETAIDLGNATRFGLSASLVCEDIHIWEKVRLQLRAGILNLNRPTVGASSHLPFGGPGLSGNLRPGGYYAADYCAWPQASQISPVNIQVSASS